MVKLFSLLLPVSLAFALSASSQNALYINAGSRASYGTYQSLLVNASGQCIYKRIEVNKNVKDSMNFSISKPQLDSILGKADQLGFFQLNNEYDGGRSDGAGITISINNGGRKKTVDLLNTDVPQVNQLVAYVNHILEPQKIRIYYGQK